MRPFLFSCLAVTLVFLAVYSIHCFYSLGDNGVFSPVISNLVTPSHPSYPVVSIGEVFRRF